ncbi:hypothetical protein R1sor_020011 [Riccia sorocarpa]|uniref:Reverse transcriptase domain-containing protein n=1 Tax=Riccia sorocarpa TaxID=122646 RepID=A0ABD3IKE3_9MARC
MGLGARNYQEGQWILLGDLNMVEATRDSMGPSPVLRGRELRSWTLCRNQGDLIDGWKVALESLGPWFTRQAVHGTRIDQSRIDRLYISNRGDWVEIIAEVKHHGASSMSDHVPASGVLVLEKDRGRQGGSSTRPYFKMRPGLMEKQEVIKEAERVWSMHPSWARDARKRWALGLGRIRRLLMAERDKQEREEEDTISLQRQLQTLRLDMQEDGGEHRREEWERVLYRLRNREKWMLRWRERGVEYVGLMRMMPRETERIEENRRRVLLLMDKKMTTEQNGMLREMPDVTLIEHTVRKLPKDKTPGLDGVVTEILMLRWHFMRDDCVAMVLKVWSAHKLLNRDNRGVIKLIPKNEETMWLTNWRPRTLLTVTYKIIARIIADRLKGVMPELVDVQQSGFIAGRDIIENVLSLRLAHEWSQVSGMEEDNMSMIRGLVEGGKSQVHVNGSFTKEFPVLRGVRQGCPLAPLLFALTTQPLMRLLRVEEVEGRLAGINIGEGKNILHHLYADDTGINITLEERYFRNLQQTISRFEEVSGAKLNLAKSLIMPLAPGRMPAWVYRTGCEVAEAGKPFKYLGISTSSPVNEKQITAGVIKKMENKLAHWSNRLLSWPAKTILLRHVLAATPLYQLMSVGLDGEGLDKLESLCRQFMWGWAEQKNPKKALIAWERIVQDRSDGGLNWSKFKDKAAAMNIKTLLFTTILKVRGSPTLSRMLRSWKKAKEAVVWNENSAEIPGHLTISQIMLIKNWNRNSEDGWNTRTVAALRQGGITTMEAGLDLLRNGTGWLHQLRTHGIFPEEFLGRKIQELEGWVEGKTSVHSKLAKVGGWEWRDGRPDFQWANRLKVWLPKIRQSIDFNEELNGRWRLTMEPSVWKVRWRQLWEARMSYRKKIWLWRLLQRGYFIGSRTAEMRVSDGFCTSCPLQVETLEHIFWFCRKGRDCRNTLRELGAIPSSVHTLIEWIDDCLQKSRTEVASVNLLTNFLDKVWKDRNDRLFRGTQARTPAILLLRLTYRDIDAFPRKNTNAATLVML